MLSRNFVTSVPFHRNHIIFVVCVESFVWEAQHPWADLEFSHNGLVRSCAPGPHVFRLPGHSHYRCRCLFSVDSCHPDSPEELLKNKVPAKGFLLNELSKSQYSDGATSACNHLSIQSWAKHNPPNQNSSRIRYIWLSILSIQKHNLSQPSLQGIVEYTLILKG